MTAAQAADFTGIPRKVFLAALRGGRVNGKKVRRRWHISLRDAWRLKIVNDTKLQALREEYISLYLRGATVAWLQARTAQDMTERHIVWPVAWFAEQTIYQAVRRAAAPAGGEK